MKLNTRQRAKVNAALCLIHDNGYDAKPIIKRANELMKTGDDTRTAYELALNEFIQTEPGLLPAITKAHNLVDASDDKTVDRYDAALSDYVTTGDNSSLNELAPMIAEDSLALAVRNGEITQEEADSGDIAKALGFEPGPALVEAIATRGEQSNERKPEGEQQAPKPNQPEYPLGQKADVPQLGDKPPPSAPSFVNGSQVGAASAPTGMVAAGAAANWARNTTSGLPNGTVAAPSI
jgi:hypothetical protein